MQRNEENEKEEADGKQEHKKTTLAKHKKKWVLIFV